jgi:hypothetical protein
MQRFGRGLARVGHVSQFHDSPWIAAPASAPALAALAATGATGGCSGFSY